MPNVRSQVEKTIHVIFDMFRQSGGNTILAAEAQARAHVSRQTLIKAKNFLGIRHMRQRSEHRFRVFWSPPKISIEQALTRLYQDREQRKKERKKDLERPDLSDIACVLRDFMLAEGTNYEVLGREVLQAMYPICSRRTTMKVKKKLGIRSVKRQTGWWWIYPAQEVQDWLENLLLDWPPMLITDIIPQAQERGWSFDALELARYYLGVGNVIEFKHEGLTYWYSAISGAPLEDKFKHVFVTQPRRLRGRV